MHTSKWFYLVLALALLVSCGTEAPADDGSGAGSATGSAGATTTTTSDGAGGSDVGGAGGMSVGGSAPVMCDLGTIYPSRPLIDPDNPDYEEPGWTKQQVIDAFAAAKAQDSQAYRGYRAAFQYSEFLECPFCACGCAAPAPTNHLSAVDCFKDMHGFT